MVDKINFATQNNLIGNEITLKAVVIMAEKTEILGLAGLGARLRKLRRKKDVTQQVIADELHVKCAAVSKYESGGNNYPRTKHLIMLAKYYEVSLDYLLLGKEFTPKTENIETYPTDNSAGQTTSGKELSPEIRELIRIYDVLKGGDRFKLIDFALRLEKKSQ